MVKHRTRDREVPGSIPTNCKCCFLEQETLSTLLSTGFYPGKKRVTWKISTRLLNVLPSINKVDYYYYYYYYYFSNFGRSPVPDDLCKDSATKRPPFWRRRFLKVFTIYGHGGHLGQRAATILAIFRYPNLRRLHLSKIGSGASEEKSFENVNGRTDARMHARTDGRTDEKWSQ